MTLAITPVTADLPAGFALLCTEARNEGHRHMERLATDWTKGATRFDAPGEALLAAFVTGTLAGIGGMTIDPADPDALRMRRFYVRPEFRRHGVGRRLTKRLSRRRAMRRGASW